MNQHALCPVGVAGCGRMGLPMLKALKEAGFTAFGYDVKPLSAFGHDAPFMQMEPGRFAAPLKTLISVVRDAKQTDAMLKALLPHAVHLECLIVSSTVSPNYIKELRDRLPDAITLIDAPMSGAPIAAQERRLSFMMGGELETLLRYQPFFVSMGQHFHHMGPLGAGAAAKVMNNVLAASNTLLTRTMLDWAQTYNIAPQDMLGLMHTSSGQNWLASNFDSIEFARHGYEPDNSIAILVKDLQAAIDAAPKGADTKLLVDMIPRLRKLKPFEG